MQIETPPPITSPRFQIPYDILQDAKGYYLNQTVIVRKDIPAQQLVTDNMIKWMFDDSTTGHLQLQPHYIRENPTVNPEFGAIAFFTEAQEFATSLGVELSAIVSDVSAAVTQRITDSDQQVFTPPSWNKDYKPNLQANARSTTAVLGRVLLMEEFVNGKLQPSSNVNSMDQTPYEKELQEKMNKIYNQRITILQSLQPSSTPSTPTQ